MGRTRRQSFPGAPLRGLGDERRSMRVDRPKCVKARAVRGISNCLSELEANASSQLVEQRLGFLQNRRVETFGEPAVNRGEEIAGFIVLALVKPEASEAG